MKDLYTILKIASLVLSIFAALIVFLIWFDIDMFGLLSLNLKLSLIIFTAAIVLLVIVCSVLFFGVVNLINNSSNIMSIIVPVVTFVALFVYCLIFAPGAEQLLRDGTILSAFSSKLISASISFFQILASMAICFMLYFGIVKDYNTRKKGLIAIPIFVIVFPWIITAIFLIF